MFFFFLKGWRAIENSSGNLYTVFMLCWFIVDFYLLSLLSLFPGQLVEFRSISDQQECWEVAATICSDFSNNKLVKKAFDYLFKYSPKENNYVKCSKFISGKKEICYKSLRKNNIAMCPHMIFLEHAQHLTWATLVLPHIQRTKLPREVVQIICSYLLNPYWDKKTQELLLGQIIKKPVSF